ncbi:MAG: flavin reductase family protein [Candidatus Zixiibacteriota bacterium]
MAVKDIKKVLRKLEYGVYVVSMGKGNEGNAFTASWVTQVSSEPPMVMIAVNNKHKSTPILKEQGAFVINLVGRDHESVAKKYYGPAEGGYEKLKTADVHESPATKTPLLNGMEGFLDCQIVETVLTGNHTIFIGEVLAAEIENPDVVIMTSYNSKLRYGG